MNKDETFIIYQETTLRKFMDNIEYNKNEKKNIIR